ncbi:MAG: zinc-binding metallopeptidase family protein [Polaromonas sp.]
MSSKTPSNAAEPPLPAGRNYRCQCGQPVFFRNSRCLACDTPLGYDCERGILLPLMPGPQPDTWQEWQARSGETGAPVYKRCRDLSTPAACNWLIPVEDPQDMCRACRLNRTIPDLTDPAQPDNGYLWGLLEQAKRRLVSSLILLKLPVASRMSEDPERGLMFDFLRSPVNGLPVVTGHDTGLITLNVDEADDAKREAVRKTMREPYRTLLGHFRHEVGHYYWGRLIAGTPWLEGFHELFGDESVDYMASLQRSYYQGPPSDWPLHFVSAYASTHPWEDWAECWAHYLHMRDAIDTALSFGLSVDRFDLEFTPFTLDALYQPDHPDAEQFLAFLNHWTQLTTMLNEMSRSMGQPDFYPFVLSREVVGKLHFIHLVVNSGSWLQDPVPLQP